MPISRKLYSFDRARCCALRIYPDFSTWQVYFRSEKSFRWFFISNPDPKLSMIENYGSISNLHWSYFLKLSVPEESFYPNNHNDFRISFRQFRNWCLPRSRERSGRTIFVLFFKSWCNTIFRIFLDLRDHLDGIIRYSNSEVENRAGKQVLSRHLQRAKKSTTFAR